jgi:Domain of unknown function (DUF4395)
MQAQPHSPAGVFKSLWFRAPDGAGVVINDVAVRIRAGLLLAIPLYMGFTLLDVVGGSHWVVTGAFIQDTFDTDFDGRILYHVEAVKRTFEYSRQSYILLYALFEMLVGMFKVTSRLSPTILISSWLARRSRPEWKPLAPKRFAWSIGAALIASCLVFFNPDVFAVWVNRLSAHALLPTTANYMPRWVPMVSVWVCIGFMWMETVLGVCVGCHIHALLVRMKVLKDDCYACNNLRWD